MLLPAQLRCCLMEYVNVSRCIVRSKRATAFDGRHGNVSTEQILYPMARERLKQQ